MMDIYFFLLQSQFLDFGLENVFFFFVLDPVTALGLLTLLVDVVVVVTLFETTFGFGKLITFGVDTFIVYGLKNFITRHLFS